MSRPEHTAPPEVFYDDTEARKYTTSSRMIEIQAKMTERAIELMNLKEGEPALILDIGCGSGLSGDVLTEHGYDWIGIDISASMLDVATERECEGDLFLWDMGQGLSFRPGTFDGAISISALQWLCYQDKSWNVPRKRLAAFFQSLYDCMRRGARCVFQFFPEHPQQVEMITRAAMKCGFSGGVVIDYPNSTKAKRFFLTLFAGPSSDPRYSTPRAKGVGMEDDEEDDRLPSGQVSFTAERSRSKRMERTKVKSKEWIQKKKERQRRQGKEVRHDSKFTGRNRRPRF